MHQNRKSAFMLLFLVMVLVGLANSSLFVILPLLVEHLGLGEIYVGMIYVGSALMYMLCSPLWGWRADHKGRKPVLLFGIFGNTLSQFSMALAAGWVMADKVGGLLAIFLLASARFLYGSLGSAMQPAAQGYVADRSERHERTLMMSLLAAGMGFGASFGPPLAAFLVTNVSATFVLWLMAGLSIVLFIAISFAMPEHQCPEWHGVTGRQMLGLIGHERLRSLLLIGAMSWMAQGVFLQTAAFFVSDRLHLSAQAATPKVGTILGLGALCVLGVQFLLIPFWKPAPRTLLITGLGFAVTGAAIMVFAPALTWIMAAVVISSTGFGMIRPGLSGAASLRMSSKEQGGAAGLITATAGAGFVLAPTFGLSIYHVAGPAATYVFLSVVLLVVWLLAFRQPTDPVTAPD